MMDAYLPNFDTHKPCLSVPSNDQPWRPLSNTQTLMWYQAPKPAVGQGLSSLNQKLTTFVVLDSPALAGLERLRTFRGWQDNWDAEGAKAPDPQVVDFATKVFGLLSVHRVPEVTMSADGNPMFVYGAPLSGEVVVTSVGTLDYFFAQDDTPEGESVALSKDALPIDLISHLQSVS